MTDFRQSEKYYFSTQYIISFLHANIIVVPLFGTITYTPISNCDLFLLENDSKNLYFTDAANILNFHSLNKSVDNMFASYQ